MNEYRQIGKTTAMLEVADLRKRSNGGTRVLIIVHSARMIHYCLDLAQKLQLTLTRSDFVTFSSDLPRRLRGFSRDQVFVDYDVWDLIMYHEQKDLQRELSMLGR